MSASISSIKKEPGKFAIEGELTIYEAAEFKEPMLATLVEHQEVDFDLAGVQEIDSAGLQLLILAKREAKGSGKSLKLSNHSQPVLDIFDLCDLFHFFGDQVVFVVKDAGQKNA